MAILLYAQSRESRLLALIDALSCGRDRDYVATRAGGIMGPEIAQYCISFILATERKHELCRSLQSKHEWGHHGDITHTHTHTICVILLCVAPVKPLTLIPEAAATAPCGTSGSEFSVWGTLGVRWPAWPKPSGCRPSAGSATVPS